MKPSIPLLGKINASITQRKLPTTFKGIRLLENAKVTHGAPGRLCICFVLMQMALMYRQQCTRFQVKD